MAVLFNGEFSLYTTDIPIDVFGYSNKGEVKYECFDYSDRGAKHKGC